MAMNADELGQAIAVHGRTVFSIAQRICRDPGVAEEVAQDVFLELHRHAERLESEDHLRFWLRRVAVHRATDAVRRRGRQPESGAEEWMEMAHGAEPAESGRGVSEGVSGRLETMVGSLPEAMRVAVVLRYAEDLTPEEISVTLGQPLPTVKSNLQRGLKLLRQKAAVTMKGFRREQRA